MIRLIIMWSVALALSVSIGVPNANAQESMLEGPSTKSFLECATKCQKTFYFSEQSDVTFAQLRNACIEGCGVVVDANMSAYQSCNVGCQDIYPYRHGINSDFAGFQETCIVGCRRVH
ncbi:MAG: hypothetical protein E4H01_07590 [Lysobacterales bacterium]|nr:MAG: hypothetical protein E4H01_07590 [Xanthomonadales bacterium]